MPSPLTHDELPAGWPGRLRPERLTRLAFQTPYLAGDVTVITERLVEFRSALPGIEPYYSMRANPAPEVLSTLAGLGIGFRAGSFTELKMLMDLGIEGPRVLFGNPLKIGPHLRAAATAGVWRMAFDSEAELQRIAEFAPGAGVYLQLSIADGTGKPLGARPDQAQALMATAQGLGLVPFGLSFHLGPRQAAPDVWRAALGVVGQVMSDLLEDGVGLALLDLGGGFPAGRTEDGDGIENFGRMLRAALDELLPYRPDSLICQPDRFLVADSAVLVTAVLDRSRHDGADWLVLDAGAHQGLAGRFPVTTSLPDDGAPLQTFSLAGPSDEGDDVIARGVKLPGGLAPGDLVMFGGAGAHLRDRVAGYSGFAPPRTLFV